jgi:hypothetical protein
MLFADGGYAPAAAQHHSRCHAVLALEVSGEVGLVGEAGALGDAGERGISCVEQAARALEAKVE